MPYGTICILSLWEAICTSSGLSTFTNAILRCSLRSSYNSPLVAITPSREPNPCRCAFPTLVMSPKLGHTSFTSVSISPGLLAPISITAARVSPLMRNRVRGTPIWLLRLPSVAITLYFFLRHAAISSLVVVLPFVPVRATTGILNCLR